MHIPSLQPFWKAQHRLSLPVFSPSGRGWAGRARIVYRITLPSLCDMAQQSTKRDREAGKKKAHITFDHFFCLSPSLIVPILHYPRLVYLTGLCLPAPAVNRFGLYSVFTGVISYHSIVGESRRVRCGELQNDTIR